MAGAPPRDRRHRIGFACTALLIAVGVAAFVGLRGTVHDLDRSLARFYDDTRFADLVVVGGDADTFATAARDVPGVSAVNTRATTTLSVWLDNGRTKVQGTIVGVPATGPPIDTLSITAGRDFARDTSSNVAIVEQHTADDLGVAPGDSVQALGIGSVAELKVSGVGVSPEYLLPAQNQQQIVTAPGSFAVLYVPQTLARQLGGAAAIPQTLVRYEPGADRDALDPQLGQIAVDHRAALVVPRSEQPSNAVIAEEQTGFDEASVVVPALILLLAMLIGAVAASRVREPATRRRLVAIATASGSVLGVVVGLAGARVGGAELADAVILPSSVASANVGIALVGLGLGAAAGGLALVISRLAGSGTEAALGAGPAIVTALAAAIAVACVVAPAGVVDSAEATLDAAGELERADSQVAFVAAVTPADLEKLRAIPGVTAAEPVPSADVVVIHGNTRYATEVEAFRARTTMQRFESPDGTPLALTAAGALIPESLGGILGARPGDEIEIELPGAGVSTLRVPIAAFTSDTLGNLVFMRISTLRAALGADADSFAGGLFDTATIRFRADADQERIARAVQAIPDVAVYVPVQADLDSVASARPIFAAITDALLAIGAVIALLGIGSAVLVHVHARASSENARLTLEVFAAAVAGIVAGSILGTVGANRLVDALDSDLVHLVRHLDASTYLLAGGLVLAVTAVVLVVGVATAPKRGRPTADPP